VVETGLLDHAVSSANCAVQKMQWCQLGEDLSCERWSKT